ncbi:hypothetical protein IW18_11455 [Flavobacterium hibernum]|uniref:Lipoprotein n=1 Tax=Flavobacterium hibernum TaxID=37752 RepID=A0A0D0F370_9FLAO|nr:hypothetical protein IW18_11455 [Flavobacterium hibernum]OXA89181.1 hypothetical protein B0A73_06290 [Flavobacterium hibernum]
MIQKISIVKKIFILFVCTLLFACNQKQKENQINQSEPEQKELSPVITNQNSETDTTNYQISTFYNTEEADRIKRQKESLKQLSEKKVFLDIHNKLIQKINAKQQSFFKKNPNYKLLSVAQGNLFQENSNDFAFIVYDTKNIKTSILLYNGKTSTYAELFKDIKVINGLKNANCSFYSFGTLDYQFANEFLVSNEDYLLKSIESFLEYPSIKITDISKDENFILKDGCFAKNVSKTNLANTLCIPTSSIYNNWECLRYNKTSNSFLIFYGQAFAD